MKLVTFRGFAVWLRTITDQLEAKCKFCSCIHVSLMRLVVIVDQCNFVSPWHQIVDLKMSTSESTRGHKHKQKSYIQSEWKERQWVAELNELFQDGRLHYWYPPSQWAQKTRSKRYVPLANHHGSRLYSDPPCFPVLATCPLFATGVLSTPNYVHEALWVETNTWAGSKCLISLVALAKIHHYNPTRWVSFRTWQFFNLSTFLIHSHNFLVLFCGWQACDWNRVRDWFCLTWTFLSTNLEFESPN